MAIDAARQFRLNADCFLLWPCTTCRSPTNDSQLNPYSSVAFTNSSASSVRPGVSALALRRHPLKLVHHIAVERPAGEACEWDRANMRSTEIVTAFWDDVWNAHQPDAIDRFVTDDVVVEVGGREIAGKANMKGWIEEFLARVDDLHVDTLETFQNEDGSRVSSRWVLTGTNNGFLGTEPNGKPIAMTGTAVWSIGDDGRLQRGSVEQASFEIYRTLLAT